MAYIISLVKLAIESRIVNDWPNKDLESKGVQNLIDDHVTSFESVWNKIGGFGLGVRIWIETIKA